MKFSLPVSLIIPLLLSSGCTFLTEIGNDETSVLIGDIYTADQNATNLPLSSDSASRQTPVPAPPLATNVTLRASSDFRCTINWVKKQGAMSLVANTDEGACLAEFPGVTGRYSIRILIQTEFAGKPMYALSINGKSVFSGQYPLSNPQGCDCPLDEWSPCPDQIVEIDAGIHTVTNKDSLEFYGKEDLACGFYGASAKWHQIRFTPAW